jgi:hypothetical protein
MNDARRWLLFALLVPALMGCQKLLDLEALGRQPSRTDCAERGNDAPLVVRVDPPRSRCATSHRPRIILADLEPEGVSGASAGVTGPRMTTPGGIAAGLHGTPVAGDPVSRATWGMVRGAIVVW